MNLRELYLPENPKWINSTFGDIIMFLGVQVGFFILYPADFEGNEWDQQYWPRLAIFINALYLVAPVILLRPVSFRRLIQAYGRTGMVFLVVTLLTFCVIWWMSGQRA
jgi:hypothetical protein